MNIFPDESSTLKELQMPFGLIATPLAEQPEGETQVPIIDPGKLATLIISEGMEGIFRCTRCRCYVNPFMNFIENGTKAVCNLCQFINDVPADYVASIDQFGSRRDKNERPELSFGTYEYLAPE